MIADFNYCGTLHATKQDLVRLKSCLSSAVFLQTNILANFYSKPTKQ